MTDEREDTKNTAQNYNPFSSITVLMHLSNDYKMQFMFFISSCPGDIHGRCKELESGFFFKTKH